MASTNFLVFDEGKQNMMSDGDYSANTQRARGVTPGIAYPNLHNKLYYQVSVMAKAIADFMVAQGANANDEDVEQLTADISTAFTNFVDNKTKDVYLPLSGGTMKGDINANGYNITATKFIGNLQGKADSATNADLATKANQDSQGQVINTTYVKGITASNATLTLTKGNGTTSTVTINNVENSKKATQDGNGDTINTTYLKLSGGTMTGDLKLNNTSERKIVGSNNDVGFYISTNGNIGLYDWDSNLGILQYTKNSNSVTSITPATSDNSTKIATTAFVKSLFTASKTTNGWHKEASTGIIWQWGTVTNTNINSNFNITFPITFNTALNAYISSTYGQGLGADSISGAEIISLTKEGMEIRSEWDNNVSRTYRYFAIGY